MYEEQYEPVEPPVPHFSSHPVSLGVISTRYGRNLPQVILAASESAVGAAQGLLKDGQELEVYFKKETPIITMMMEGKTYTVPLSSTFMFSVLYNPKNEDLSIVRRGHHFPTVADLMKADPLPTVVYVGRDCVTSKGREVKSIPKGTILIIQEIIKMEETKILRCSKFDDPSNDIYLDRTSEGHFTTRESLLIFSLPELIKHIKCPCDTSMYNSDGKTLCPMFKDKFATIYDKRSTMHSFIAGHSSTITIVELYAMLPVKFHISSKSDKELYQIMKKANMLSQTLSPDQVTSVIYHDSPTDDSLQEDLLLPLNNSAWLKEINFSRSRVYEPLNLLTKASPVKPHLSQVQQESAAPSHSHSSKNVIHLLPHCIYKSSKRLKLPLQDATTDLKDMALSDARGSADLPDFALEDNVSYGLVKKNDLTGSANDIRESMTKGQHFETNKKLLADYDTYKLGELLDLMGLQQYCVSFSNGSVDGKNLFGLDDAILQDEFGISNRIHRIRLMKIIRGDQCVSDIIRNPSV
uniref:SAM domain-containing protein n=1 Tax=Amphimedon queenslandica TaxID=400682 RepID=A0A1X7U205_AMPQE